VTARKKASSISPRGMAALTVPARRSRTTKRRGRSPSAGSQRRLQAIALHEFVERGGEFGVVGGLGGVVAGGEGRVAPGVELQLDGEQRPLGRLRQFGEALGYEA